MNRKRRLLWCVSVALSLTIIALWFLISQQRRHYEQRTHCCSNLVFFRIAKTVCAEELGLKQGDPVPQEALDKALLNSGVPLTKLKCPNGGAYVIGGIGSTPACTYTNLSYTWEIQKDPPWLKRRAWRHSIGP